MLVKNLYRVVVGLVVSGLASASAGAATAALESQTLVKVTSDQDSNISRLAAMVDGSGEVKAIRFDTKHFDKSPAVTTTKTFNMKDITSARGAVLLNKSGYDAVILKAAVDSKSGEGSIVIRFLSNALFSSYDTCKALVRRDGDGHWQLINAFSKKPIQDIFVQSHSMGITTIRGICQ